MSPSGLAILVDGVELAGSFVSELEDRLAGSCGLPRTGGAFAEKPPSLPGVSMSAFSLLPQLHLTWDSLPSWAELSEASQMPGASGCGAPSLSPRKMLL